MKIDTTSNPVPHLRTLFTFLLLILCTAFAHATAIIVPNFSFELPAQTDGAFQLAVNSWTSAGFPGGVYNPQNAQFPGSSGSGNLPAPALGPQCGFLDRDSNLTTTSSLATILADTTYTLTIALGSRLDVPTSPTGTATLSFLANSVVIPGASTTITTTTTAIPPGTFADFTASFTTGTSSPQVGQNLTARIAYTAPGGQLMFDNVRVDATPAPEPSTWAMLAAGTASLLALRRRSRNRA